MSSTLCRWVLVGPAGGGTGLLPDFPSTQPISEDALQARISLSCKKSMLACGLCFEAIRQKHVLPGVTNALPAAAPCSNGSLQCAHPGLKQLWLCSVTAHLLQLEEGRQMQYWHEGCFV